MFASHGWLPTLLCLLLCLVSPARSEPPRLDAYGDPLPKHARFRLGTERLRHGDSLMNLAWLADGRTLATASWDGTVRLWQIPGGKLLASWNKADAAEDVLFSSDGRIAACGGKHRAIRFVDVATGKELRRLREPKIRLSAAAFSPDGKILAAVEWKSFFGLFPWVEGIGLYAVDSGKKIHRLQGRFPSEHVLAFVPDGRTLAVASEKGIERWNVRTGEKGTPLWKGEVSNFAFSPDGKTLAMVSGPTEATIISLRSWPAGKELHRFTIKGEYFFKPRIAFSPDGKLLALNDNNQFIRVCDVVTGTERRRFKGDGRDMLLFSRDGSLLASDGLDRVVTLWAVRASEKPRSLTGMGHRLHAVAMTPNGRTLLTHARDGALTLWDGRDGRRLRTLAHCDGYYSDIFFSPDGKRALALTFMRSFGTPLWWDVATGRRLPAFAGIPKQKIDCAAFSPDSALLALGEHMDPVIHLRETLKGREIRRLQTGEDVYPLSKLAFSPDGRVIAAGCCDGRLILWDLRTNRPRPCIRKWPRGDISGELLYSADGRLLAEVDPDQEHIHLFETASGQEFRRLRVPPPLIGSLAFAPDNRTLAIGDCPPAVNHNLAVLAAIRLWDWPSDKPGPILRGHHGSIHTLAFSADGAALISGSEDETVLCWDIADLLSHRPTSKELSASRWAELWNNLAAKDAERGQGAVAELILASDAALPFLAKALPPALPVKMARVAALIADLDHQEFNRRDAASQQLRKIGATAVPALRKVLTEKPTLEMRKRISAILDSIEQGEVSPQWLRTIRALQALEAIGSPQARQILEALSLGAPEAGLTQEAKAALQRLNRRNGKR